MDGNPISNQTPEQGTVQPKTNKTSKRSSRTLQLAHIPSNSHTVITSTMANSPTSTRRRATLTPHQSWLHATGSFFPPEPHIYGEWAYCEEPIPEVNSSDSSTTSKGATSPNLNIISASDSPSEAYTSSSTPYTTPPSGCRSRSGSHTGVRYSSAHRRVPSSPSFRSTLTLVPHGYFDRPPSPSSSISSRSSELPINASLSLSELLASTTTIPLGEFPTGDVDELNRREVQREERKQAMKERHVAIRERRERERCTKVQTRC